MFLPVLVFVRLSVTTITKNIVDGFEPNFMRRFLGGREDQVRVSLQSVEGCGSNGQQSSVGKFGTSGPQNSRCGKCCQVLTTKTLSRGFVLSQSTFHLVDMFVRFVNM